MKKSELKGIIRECMEELTEASEKKKYTALKKIEKLWDQVYGDLKADSTADKKRLQKAENSFRTFLGEAYNIGTNDS